jgi:hypothetical protein
MDAWLNDPMVQSSLAPFLAGLVVAAALFMFRLGGLAAIAGFCTTAWLTGGLQFVPLTATRKLMVLALAAPAIGLLADFGFKATRATEVVLGVLFGAGAVWMVLAVLAQREMLAALLAGGGIALFTAWTVGASTALRADSVRAGAAGMGLALGAGFAALMAASASLAQYGMGLGAACGAFLLVQMIAGRRIEAGLTFTLTAGAIGALVAAAAAMLANLRWIELALLAAVPLAVRLPVPLRWPVWAQAVTASLYALACGGAATAAAYFATR